MTTTSAGERRRPWLPPRWFVRLAWITHRAIHRLTGGRRGLKSARPGVEGYLRLRTIGRRSGRERAAILSYFEDGPNLVTMAMNGWADPEPAWWLNLLAHPEAIVDLKGGETRRVRARAAEGPERDRLWALLDQHNGWGSGIDGYADRRSRPTAVVVLGPVG
ncbi:MAG: nitroreductase/quinone reductase family protein [Chloroflexota bacterium]